MGKVIRRRPAMATGMLCTLLWVGTARAAVGELDITYPYTPLGTLGGSIPGASGVLHGLGNVELEGWTFPFADTSFSEVMVSADGFLTVGNGYGVCGCTSLDSTDTNCNSSDYQQGHACNQVPPTVAASAICGGNDCTVFAPRFSPGLIAPYYAYSNQGSSLSLGTLSSFQGGADGGHFLVVDYDGVGPDQESYTYECTPSCCYCYQAVYTPYPHQFQAILFESGAIAFTYGNGTDQATSNGNVTDNTGTAIVGAYFPPPGGGMGVTDAGVMLGPSKLFGANGCMTQWENSSMFCTISGNQESPWSFLNSAYMGELDTAFLTSRPSPTLQPGPGGPTIDVTVAVTNHGKTPQAGGFPIDFFLVPQGVPPYHLPSTCTGQSTCLGSLTFGTRIPAGGSASQTLAGLALPSPLPPSGIYTLASAIDPANTTLHATAPLLEIGTSSQTFEVGQDMTGEIDRTSLSAVKPGEFLVPLEFTNLGLEEAISVPYTLDFVDAFGNVTQAASGNLYGVGGRASQSVKQDVVLPTNPELPAGAYELQLVIGAGSPVDVDLTNNIAVGGQRVENGQDMTGSIVSVPFAIPTPTTFQVPVAFRNLGLQPATHIEWTMFLTSAGTAVAEVASGEITLAGLSAENLAVSATVASKLPSGDYHLSVQLGPTSAPGTSTATPDLNTFNNLFVDPTPTFVYSASVDYSVGPGDLALDGATEAADGQVISLTRTIHNLQGPAGPCPYSYFLNPPSVTQIGNGVPVAILGPSGPTYVGTTPPFGPYGEPSATDSATDRLLLPVGIPVGTYNLVLALDPENQVSDADPSNNDVAVSLDLGANPLQITSPSSLTTAIEGTPYLLQLQESGAGGDASWSLLAGSLPPGIALDGSGRLSGTPTQAGAFDIVVQLSSEGGTQVAVLRLPVASSAGALAIEQSGPSLPTAIVGSPYLEQLVAQGGVPPYTWKGTLPPAFSMMLSSAGALSGTPLAPSGGPLQFTVIVTDAIGTQASATMTLQVLAPGSLTITTPFLEPAVVGLSYNQPIICSDGTLTGAVFSWSLSTQTPLPNGIQFQQIGTPAVAELSGHATQAGIFPVVLNLSDNFGHATTRQYVLTVAEAPIPVGLQALPVAVIGQTYSAELEATDVSTPSWRIFSGELPPGLSLAPIGTITGTVPSGSAPGSYTFSVAVSDATGAESVVPLEIRAQLPPAPAGGCATGGGPSEVGWLWFALALGGAWLGRTARREARRPGRGPGKARA